MLNFGVAALALQRSKLNPFKTEERQGNPNNNQRPHREKQRGISRDLHPVPMLTLVHPQIFDPANSGHYDSGQQKPKNE